MSTVGYPQERSFVERTMHYMGLDVSKLKIDCCLISENSEKKKQKVIKNSPNGMNDLLSWLEKNKVPVENLHIVMEGTGAYHHIAAYLLHEAGATLSIANPMQVKNFGKGIGIKTKTDTVDSFVLAYYCMLKKPAAWQPPPEEALILRDLIQRSENLKDDIQREKNRREKFLFTAKNPRVEQSIQETINFMTSQLEKITQEIDDLIKNNPHMQKTLALLQSIPAVGSTSARAILALMYEHTFNSAEQMASYIGVVPIQRTSGTSVYSRPRMSKTGPSKIRAILYMSAITAIRYNPHCKALYKRLTANGKSKMTAVGTVMRKLVHLCYGVIKTKTRYDAHYAPC